LDFIKELPDKQDRARAEELVQVEEPMEAKGEMGYR
jgi:hypothetical protein